MRSVAGPWIDTTTDLERLNPRRSCRRGTFLLVSIDSLLVWLGSMISGRETSVLRPPPLPKRILIVPRKGAFLWLVSFKLNCRHRPSVSSVRTHGEGVTLIISIAGAT